MDIDTGMHQNQHNNQQFKTLHNNHLHNQHNNQQFKTLHNNQQFKIQHNQQFKTLHNNNHKQSKDIKEVENKETKNS
ncbi:protein of unknown function, DUF4106 family [Trichomonas vaginalis G3]|uniref:protein of unknown function, DUF4106 family n=1 Tax=Trichomonas vaginalis (strain ATCC PRA-98 / G3) TaxID=412133 RepID=UPI0021E61B0B|nr:protein of unknown function, DUF4106 family [Trichomonas vaginalis G3]KAI5505198.1 protein of unknown function, DUF4106 family [Trichomonas vaginalis G3]